jgi:hypothetical protein
MKQIIIIIIACISIISCSKEESQLDRSIFIPDESNENLPAYSELGYNVFGAKYERSYFLASNSIVPCKIVYRRDSIHFMMQGIRTGYYSSLNVMSLIISFPSEKIEKYSDFVTFNKKTVDLSAGCVVKTVTGASEKILNVTEGKLKFERAQLLSIDDIADRAILSGTFDIYYTDENLFPESFSDGRFDFGITEREFYYYKD